MRICFVGDVRAKAKGGAVSVLIRDPKMRAELLPKFKSYLASAQAVAHVFTNQEAHSIGLPAEAGTDQAPQLYLIASPDDAFRDDASGELKLTNPISGQHGYLNTIREMQTLFVASGATIQQGMTLASVSNLQVAPTIAKILDAALPDALAGGDSSI